MGVAVLGCVMNGPVLGGWVLELAYCDLFRPVRG